MSYQLIGGSRVPVRSRYVLHGGRSYGLAAGAYDTRYPLVIDPGLLYSTYLGGSGGDQGFGIAVDTSGSAYVTGETSSSSFPSTFWGRRRELHGGGDVFVTKLNPAGSGLVYSTYLGGSGEDRGLGLAVDAAGSVYVTGFASTGFPTTFWPSTRATAAPVTRS